MNLDVALFRLINIDMGWDFLAPFMRVMSHLQYFIPFILVLVIWMAWKDGSRGRVTILCLLVLIPLTDQVSSHVLKPMVARPRPCRAEAGIEGVRNHGARCSGRGSFPSSHAANIAAVAMLFAWRYRRSLWIGIVFAFLVGYSRIYLGVHYPLDVLGGWILGAGLGALVAWAAFAAERRRRPHKVLTS